jgi:hypothetical protein
MIREMVSSAPLAVHLDVLATLSRTNPNAFVYVAQDALKRRDLYDGELNGLLTSSTIRAINQLCSASVAGNRCKRGPLDMDAVRVIVSLIEPSRAAQ